MGNNKLIDSARFERALTATANKIRARVATSDLIEWDESTGFASTLNSINFGDDALDAHVENTATTLVSNATALRDYALYGSSKYTRVELPLATSIGARAFQSCTGLVEVSVPQVTTLGNASFYGCSSLAKLDLPKVTSIDSSCFFRTTALVTLIIRTSKVASLGSAAFGSTNSTGGAIYKGTGYIYVPSSLVDSYKSATNWSAYADQIRAIEDYPEITGG